MVTRLSRKFVISKWPVIEVGLSDVVVGQEIAEVKFMDEVFLRDTIATESLLAELEDIMRETGIYCSIKIRARI